MTIPEILKCKEKDILRFFSFLLKNLREQNILDKDVAAVVGKSPALISMYKNGVRTSGIGKILKTLVSAWEIEIDAYNNKTGEIGNLRVQNKPKSISKVVLPKIFRDYPTWLIYIDLADEIDVTVLKVCEDGKMEYLVKTNHHDGYEGNLNVDNSSPALILDLHTKHSKKQALRIYLWIDDIGSNPSVIAGILTYYKVERGIDSFRFLAFPSKNDKPSYGKIKKQELEKIKPAIVEYFYLTGPNKLNSSAEIKDEKSLNEYLATMESRTERLIKLQIISKIRSCKDLKALEKISSLLESNFKL